MRALLIGVLFTAGISVGVAGAASIHRMAAVAGTGSEGAVTYNNTSTTGAAIEGTVSTSPDTSVKLPFAMLGEYLASSSQFGIGVGGVSTTGYGVAAEALGPNPALYVVGSGSGGGAQIDATGSGAGLTLTTAAAGEAITVNNSGTVAPVALNIANNTYGDAIDSSSFKGVAGFFSAADDGGTALLGEPGGVGLRTYGEGKNTGNPAISIIGSESSTTLLGANTAAGLSFLITGETPNRSGAALSGGSDVQVSGDVYVYGHVYDDCTQFPATTTSPCHDLGGGTTTTTRSAGGGDMETYGAKQSVPTVEDFGQGALVTGAAYVRLDPRFARTIASTAPYLVLLTPAGDSNGLYVSHRTLAGFEVHENHAGRSSLDFSYRIVATPLGDRSQRFAPHAMKIPGHAVIDPDVKLALASIARKREAVRTRPGRGHSQPSDDRVFGHRPTP